MFFTILISKGKSLFILLLKRADFSVSLRSCHFRGCFDYGDSAV